jgi:hypothetical protein
MLYIHSHSVFSATLLLSITALFREPKAREDHLNLIHSLLVIDFGIFIISFFASLHYFTHTVLETGQYLSKISHGY